LGRLVPRDVAQLTRMAGDESWSASGPASHFRTDIEAGRALGRAVGRTVTEPARRDGAE